MICEKKTAALRMIRQCLWGPKADKERYEKLFRDFSPVPVRYWSAPGSPPSISGRAGFDDYALNSGLRQSRSIIKGRFAGGSVGYVFADELEIFAGLYRKEPGRLSRAQAEILDLIEHEDGVTVSGIKKATGMLVKEIAPDLHALQEAYLIFEDQYDGEEPSIWYPFERMCPEADPKRYARAEALAIILPRFAEMNIAFDLSMARSFYKLPLSELREAADALVSCGTLVKSGCDYMLRADFEYLSGSGSGGLEPERSVIALHRNDFFVKSNENTEKTNPRLLKDRFAHEKYGTLQYILIDGEIRGALCGRFTFGPAELEDVVLDLSEAEGEERRDEIIEAVYLHHDREKSPLARWRGRELR